MNQTLLKFASALLVVLLIVGICSCSKDDDGNPETESDKITLIVDGVAYESFLIQNTDVGFGLTVIGSFSDAQHIMGLMFESEVTEGEHDLSESSAYGVLWDVVHSTYNIERFTSESGSLTVEEYNAETGKLKGTFNAVCTSMNNSNNKVTISSGTFVVFL